MTAAISDRDAMETCIKVDIADGLACVTLDRPHRRNAFSLDLMQQLIDCAADLSARHDVGVVIVSGGETYFSGGADLKDGRRWSTDTSLIEQRETARIGFKLARAW